MPLSGAVQILAAEPAGMGEFRPEGIPAALRVHPAAAILVTAEPHRDLFFGFLNGIPLALPAAILASADRFAGACILGRTTTALGTIACHTMITPLSGIERAETPIPLLLSYAPEVGLVLPVASKKSKRARPFDKKKTCPLPIMERQSRIYKVLGKGGRGWRSMRISWW